MISFMFELSKKAALYQISNTNGTQRNILPKKRFYGFIGTSHNFWLWGWGAHTHVYSDSSVNEWCRTTWMSFVTSSTEETSVKNSLTDSSLLQFTYSGKIQDNHVTDYQLIKKKRKKNLCKLGYVYLLFCFNLYKQNIIMCKSILSIV